VASHATQTARVTIVTPKNVNLRTVPADKLVQKGRFAKAKQFLRVAEDIQALSGDDDVADACVSLYVLAGVAAADAICAGALGKHAQGHDHHEAVALLASVDTKAASSLGVLLGMKTRAGYGHDPISGASLTRAERAARSLVDKASL
jgi:hypothetical protein